VRTLTASYPLTAELYRAGVRLRLWRVAVPLLLLCAIGAVVGVQLLVQGEPIWAGAPILATIMLTICAFAVATMLVTYVRLQRAEAEWLKRVGGGTATLSMDDEGLGIEIPDQRSWIRWSALREVWCGRDVWLLYRRGSNDAVIVPARAFDAAGAAFVRAKAGGAGARVRDV
jgi:hypothetical protein